MIELQKLIDEPKDDKQKANENIWLSHEDINDIADAAYHREFISLLLAVEKADLLLKKTREQQP